MAARTDVDASPEQFRVAVSQFREARLRPEVHCDEMPAPQRIAPYSAALTADVESGGDVVGGGRLVLLFDPAGNDAWRGTVRLVAYVRAEIEPDMVADPPLAEVGWSYLVECLAAHDAAYAAPSGTVTRVASESFGGMAGDPPSAEMEIRASWSPLGDLGCHVQAWADLMCTAAGLPPVPSGVVTLSRRRAAQAR